MRYWAFFASKLGAIWVLASLLKAGLKAVITVSTPAVVRFGHQPFGHDLPYTLAMLVYMLFCVGLVYLAILDQKYRCRTCLRRLRMPVNTGSWAEATIFAPPRTEYICPYGHGTMKENEVQLSGRDNPDWIEHKDIWEELESAHKK